MSLIWTLPGTRNGVYLGGKSDAKSRKTLNGWGVTHILNVTPPKEGGIQAGVANYFERNFVYKRIEVYDASTSDLLEHADSAVSFISSGLCHGSVLVHCQRGVSRSATCVAFYLMRKNGMTLKDAMTLMRQKRPNVEPLPTFMSQLQAYESKCIELGVISTKKRKMEDEMVTKHVTKRRIGPAVGPTIVPSRPSGTEGSITSSEQAASISYGPQLPATDSIVVIAKTESTRGDQQERSYTVRAHDEPEPRTIGPSLPPKTAF